MRTIYSAAITGVQEQVSGTVTDTLGSNITANTFKVAVAKEGTVPAIADFYDPTTKSNPTTSSVLFNIVVGVPPFALTPGVYRVWYKIDDNPDKPGRPIMTDTIEVV